MMAAIVRVKRRLEDDVADSIVLLCKKAKSSSHEASRLSTEEEIKSVFKFAGTVTAEERAVATQCVSQAIRKAKLQKEYKLPDKPAALKSRVEGRQRDASRSRYKIVAERRALDFCSLANDAATGIAGVDAGTVSCGDETVVKTAAEAAPAAGKRIFCLYDVEKLDGCVSKSAAQLTEAAVAKDVIACNDVPMIREKVAPPGRMASLAVPEMCDMTEGTDNFVYDVYYMNDAKFDYKSLENILAIESYREDEQFMYNFASDDDEDEEGYDDEDDENAENNWRNDYPDEDPMYFERLHLDDSYSSGDDSVDRLYGDEEDRDERP